MLKLKNFACLLLFLGLAFQSCQKEGLIDPINSNTPLNYEVPVKEINASLSGIVINESGTPISGATVEIGTSQKISDENGVFLFKNISMNEFGTLVRINRLGYFTATQMINPRAEKRSNTRVMLLTKTIVGSVMANAGGILTVNGNSKITLPRRDSLHWRSKRCRQMVGSHC